MLRKTSRLGAEEVTALYKSGRRVSSRYFSLVVADGPKPAFAVVVGKSGGVTGVMRNKVRRRVYSIIGRAILPNMRRGSSIAVGVQKSAFSLTMEETEIELTALFTRARLI